jgi:ribonuclease BN (tRNA processing enzyme)
LGNGVKLTILGCGGGIGSGSHTTCFLLDDDVLIDAGTGITSLSLEQLARIDHVFITHSHLDHVLGLPLLVDAVGDRRDKPIVVHALPETLEIFSEHLFNWKLWPDFREIPDASEPWLRFERLPLGSSVGLGARTVTSLPAHHTVPACGYKIASPGRSLVFTGDTTRSEALMHALNEMDDLRDLIIETSFENELRDIAVASMHHWPDSLAQELNGLKGNPRIWITHLKPGNQEAIMAELRRCVPGREIAPLWQGQVIEW